MRGRLRGARAMLKQTPAPHSAASDWTELLFLHVHILFAAVHLGFGLLLATLLCLGAGSASAGLPGGTIGRSFCCGLFRHWSAPLFLSLHGDGIPPTRYAYGETMVIGCLLHLHRSFALSGGKVQRVLIAAAEWRERPCSSRSVERQERRIDAIDDPVRSSPSIIPTAYSGD